MSKYFPYNPSSGMSGPFALTSENILKFAPTSHGVYILSNAYAGTFYAEYVGRARNVEERLGDHVGRGYAYFYFRREDSELNAYFGECNEFHRYGGTAHLDNVIHPDRPSANAPRCPVCYA